MIDEHKGKVEAKSSKRDDIIVPPDPDYTAVARNPKSEWNERMWVPDERFENRYQVRRSDSEIIEEMLELFSQQSEGDLSRIVVRVSEGEVMLSGDVSSEDDLKICYNLADAVLGVQHIYNNIEVIPEPI